MQPMHRLSVLADFNSFFALSDLKNTVAPSVDIMEIALCAPYAKADMYEEY